MAPSASLRAWGPGPGPGEVNLRKDGERRLGSQTAAFSKDHDVLCFCQVLQEKGNVLLRVRIVPTIQMERCLREQIVRQGEV